MINARSMGGSPNRSSFRFAAMATPSPAALLLAAPGVVRVGDVDDRFSRQFAAGAVHDAAEPADIDKKRRSRRGNRGTRRSAPLASTARPLPGRGPPGSGRAQQGAPATRPPESGPECDIAAVRGDGWAESERRTAGNLRRGGPKIDPPSERGCGVFRRVAYTSTPRLALRRSKSR